MTLVEKIFALKLNRTQVSAGEIYFVPVDLVLGTDITVPLSVKVFKEMGAKKVFDPTRLAFVNDHLVPAKDIASANLAKIMREFARQQGIRHYFELGESGICHIIVPEKGLVVPGDFVIGADSHTCTYGALGAFAAGVGSTDMAAAWATGDLWFKIPPTIKIILKGKLNKFVTGKDLILSVINRLGPYGAIYDVLEFCGPLLRRLSMAERLTICNMAVECGAKSGLIPADHITREYLRGKTDRDGVYLEADKNAGYRAVIEIDVTPLEPLLAVPYEPTKVYPVREYEGIDIQQVVIGSCTNGRIEDFRLAHKVLAGNKVNKNTRLILIPGSPAVLKQMVVEGMLEDFIDAGAVIAPSTCGPCIGGHMGVLAEDETGLYTTNRNFVGRNGAKSSKVYLCSPLVAAFSACRGKITCPE
jgi:3-isopropylmalate/(R)-2-methylmalate dehydratase large subunit